MFSSQSLSLLGHQQSFSVMPGSPRALRCSLSSYPMQGPSQDTHHLLTATLHSAPTPTKVPHPTPCMPQDSLDPHTDPSYP